MFSGRDGRRSLAFLMIVIIAASIYYLLFSQPNSTMKFSEETLSISFQGPKDTSCEFQLSDVKELTYIEDPEYGEAVDGGTLFGSNLYGTWHSSSLDNYQAFVTTKVPSCILISDGTNTIVFNYSNKDTTKSLYTQLKDFIPNP